MSCLCTYRRTSLYCASLFCVLCKYCAFYKWKVFGHPTSRKSISTIFPVTFAHVITLCHTLVTLAMNVKKERVTHLCLTLCDPMACSSVGVYVRGIFQARILEWVAMSSSRGSSSQGLNPRLLHCKQSLPLSQWGSPFLCTAACIC